MEASKSDAEMMKEITAYVTACTKAKAVAAKRKVTASESPYLKDQVKSLSPEYIFNDAAQTQEKNRQRVRREALRKRKPTDPDTILNYYAAQEQKELGIPRETLEAKALTLPFGDTIMKISEYIALDKTVRGTELAFDAYNEKYTNEYTGTNGNSKRTDTRSMSRSFSNGSAAAISTVLPSASMISVKPDVLAAVTRRRGDSRLHRKYPRLCEPLSFTDDDISRVSPTQRSDYWLARFVEDCYDEAYVVCCTPVSTEAKWRLRNGLDLGSMESFPMVVGRLLHTRYSVLELRTQMCLEFLCALERLLAISEGSRINTLPDSTLTVQERGEYVYDGERAQLFSKFLSEEYDVDFLAMFLHTREVVQTAFRFRLRGLNQARIWLDDSAEAEEQLEERNISCAQFTYYKVQQGATTSEGQAQLGTKRRIAWSAETMTLTAKLDAQIGANRRAAKRMALERWNATASSSRPEAHSNTMRTSRTSSTKGRPSSPLSGSPTRAARQGATGDRATARENTAGTSNNKMSVTDKLHPEHEGRKVVPVTLPNNWHFLHDLTLPEAPLIGFDTGLISVLCMHLLPGTPQTVRTYLTDRVVTLTRSAIVDTATAITSLATNAAVLDATGRVSLAKAKAAFAQDKVVRIVPLYILMKALCLEWKKLSLETKVSFIESGAGSASLKSLNVIYDNNNEMMRKLAEEILEARKTLGGAVARILTLEKTVRRLDRRRLADTVTADELIGLEEARVQLNKERLARSELEAQEKALQLRKKELQAQIESLWRKATLNCMPLETSTRKKKFRAKLTESISAAEKAKSIPTAEEQVAARHSDWRGVVGGWLVKVVTANLDEERALKRYAVQQSQKEHRERESQRIAAEERALAEAERLQDELHRKTDALTVGAVQSFFILEVLAKVFVRNVLRDGVRRMALREYLRRKEHELLLVYGSEEYKRRDQERLQREKADRQTRERYLLRVQTARQMSGGIVEHTFGLAKSSAEALLFDPWSLLDLHPSTWLSPAILHLVEDCFQRAKAAYQRRHLKLLFHFLRREWGVRRLQTRRDHRTCKLCLRSMWRDMMAARHLNRCATRIQRSIRCFLYRSKFQRHLLLVQAMHNKALQHNEQRLHQKREELFKFWRKTCSLAYRLKTTVAALKERRFIITFYTWLDQYKKHRLMRIRLTTQQLRACISLQAAVRCFVMRRKFLAIVARRRLGGLARRYLARNRVQDVREYERRLGDYQRSVALTHDSRQQGRYLRAWRVARRVLLGASHLDVAVQHDKLRRRFRKWYHLATFRTKRLAKRATKIQAQMRRCLVQRFVLHYYRWRRGLVKCQAAYRGRLCVRQYEYDIFFYRMAKRIQRVFRGYRCRIHLNDQRVLDIHYAAANNNYDRLLYYVNKFPELIALPDPEGNNALHSAAKNACKRTLKLLLRQEFLDPNAKNPQGYTPLHLVIMSASLQRDDCYLYMIERGFDDEVHGPDGKTTLLLAAEYGRTVIVRHLLVEEDHNPNIADANGTTALQSACWQGNAAMVRDLIDNEADVNMPGYNGTFPLHDCVYGGSKEVAQILLAHGAYVNVYEPYQYQTPLMYACSAGKSDIARLYLIQGAEVNARDNKGQTAAHLGVSSNTADIYNALREADADFDCQDNEGNSPLHVAAEVGASEFAIAMLHGGAYASWQNHRGDQPAHIAARYNQLELLKQICRYDEHIGRVNYDHQTPLGVAKFNLSKECQEFLTEHYRMVEVKDGRNKLGEIWWDKDIDDAVGHWEVSVNAAGERFYMNRKTAEVSMVPPKMSAGQVVRTAQKAELPLHRRVAIVKEENTITKHAYYLDFAAKEQEVAEIARDYVNATIIVKYARRKLARMELKRLKAHKKRTAALTQFIKRHLPGFMLWRHAVKTRSATRIQAAYRGYRLRRRYYAYPKGEYFRRRLHKAHWRLRYKLWALWKFYIRRQEFKVMRLNKNQPRTLHDWQVIIDQARRPVRRVGIYEDYLYPGTHNIHFFRHSLTGACTFTKPKKMKIFDELATLERLQVKKYGATLRQIALATRLQALWRGYTVRTYSKYVARAMQISVHAEANYLSCPDVDANLYNYALYCFVDLQDLARARRAFVEALRRMQWRGPDLPFVLYSYSIFALVARDEAYQDVMLLLDRAREAEVALDAVKRTKLGGAPTASKTKDVEFRYGKSYDLANTGFFRHLAIRSRNSFGWQAFAVCRFLVYRDFNGSFDAFMEAFRYSPEDKFLMDCFNTMMIHFHGKSREHRDAVVKERQRKLAQEDADRHELIRVRRAHAQLRSDSARAIQRWYKRCKANRIFAAFLDGVRSIIRRRQRAATPQDSQHRRSRSSAGPPSSSQSRQRLGSAAPSTPDSSPKRLSSQHQGQQQEQPRGQSLRGAGRATSPLSPSSPGGGIAFAYAERAFSPPGSESRYR